MNAVLELIGAVNSLVWGPPMLVLLLGVGLWITIGTRLVQIRHFRYAWSLVLRGAFRNGASSREAGDITPFQALMTALSATVGNGNIAGVATAIAVGGPGAPVWMWMTGLVGMATK
jgi:alanine or glycine:cation symporter, AGCS family